MDVRGGSSIPIGISFYVETTVEQLMEEGGFDEFAKRAREQLEQKLETLRPLQVRKRIAEAEASTQPNGQPKQPEPIAK